MHELSCTLHPDYEPLKFYTTTNCMLCDEKTTIIDALRAQIAALQDQKDWLFEVMTKISGYETSQPEQMAVDCLDELLQPAIS